MCHHFAAIGDNLHRTVNSPPILWKSSRFATPDSVGSLQRILLFLATEKLTNINIKIKKNIHVSDISHSWLLTNSVTSLC